MASHQQGRSFYFQLTFLFKPFLNLILEFSFFCNFLFFFCLNLEMLSFFLSDIVRRMKKTEEKNFVQKLEQVEETIC